MDIDTSCFKAFKFAAQTLNFTEAARQAHMTQSGVSNHIAKLEHDLGSQLFLRIGKKVQLTMAGRELQAFVERFDEHVQTLYDRVHDSQSSMRGLVRYAMPESCLLSPHFSMLLKDKAKNFPQVELKLILNHSEKVLEDILSHEVDFGFVTKRISNPDLHFEPFCDEEYVIAAPTSFTKDDISNSDWIQYPGFDDIADKWHSRQSKQLDKFSNGMRGQTNSLRAALTMVSHGLGITIAPKHCLNSIEERKNIRAVEEGFKPSVSQIYIATLRNYLRPARVNKTIDAFRRMKI